MIWEKKSVSAIVCRILMALVILCGMSEEGMTANYDESKVPEYALPEILKSQDGEIIDTPEKWQCKRRPEILRLFETHVYGRQPKASPMAAYEQILYTPDALNGLATLREIKITFPEKKKSPEIYLLLWTPNKGNTPYPAFIGLNFSGNQATHPDPRIRLSTQWMRPSRGGDVKENQALESSRGATSTRWPVEMIIKRGYALATIYCGDIDPDFDDGFKNGVHAMFPGFGTKDGARLPDAWGTISGWSWGLSRAMDYFEGDGSIDHNRVAVFGHSRLGKTALWAGATDRRFAMVISNNSGCGGAALNRRAFGETVQRINTSFPHWFNDKFLEYNSNENALPVDQHMLIGLIAPRPVYVASAEEDRWADPKGEWLSLKHAAPVYKLLGKDPLDLATQPEVDKPEHKDTGYHIRRGKHDINSFDWAQYLNFADQHLK